MADDIFIDPTRESFDAFKALPRDTPINMLNLLRFKPLAAYPEAHDYAGKALTGAEAYAEYGRTSGHIFKRVGGSVIWRGTMESMVTGPQDKNWELGFVAQYPHAGAFLEMTSRLIRFAPLPGGGATFA
jgi:hypothetical protein